MCIRDRGQAKQGINNFEKALGLVPGHRPTLEALVGIYTDVKDWKPVSYTHLRAHETVLDLVCRLLLEKKKTNANDNKSMITTNRMTTI